MPIDAVFDATTVTPRQGGGAHPVGNKFPFRITNTEIVETKDKKGGMFSVEFTSEVGSITHRYNLWNESEAARRIANEQLSALCYATGIFKVDFKNDGAALRNGRGLMDIGFQKGHEPSAEKPEGGYVELKKVYDAAGNEPGKAPVTQPQPQPQPQQQAGGAQQYQPQTGFNPQAQPQQNQPANNAGWSPQQTAGQPAANNPGGGGWQQNAAGGGEKPPWG